MPFLTARLNRLIMLSYEIDPLLLAPYVPPHTELDFHHRRTFVSLVGLYFQDPRVYGIPLPFYGHYPQVNLRCYVRRRVAPGNWRHGVVFIKQLIPHRPIAWMARRLFNENMTAHRMELIHRSRDRWEEMLEYGWYSGSRRYFIKAVYSDRPAYPEPGSVEEFLLERYRGFSRQQNGTCLEYRFSRPPWKIRRTNSAESGAGDFYGPPFTGVLRSRPDLSFAAGGSQVTLHRGHPI
jgi:hypothetical protein